MMDLDRKKIECRHFGYYVGLCAVFIPLLLVAAFHAFYPITQNGKLMVVIVLLLAVAIYPLFAYTFYDNKLDKKKERYVDYSFYASGLITLLLVGYIVLHTGGMSHSIFAFFFFFFPSAVAIAFETNFGLFLVCITSFFSVVMNLCYEHTKNIQNDASVFETTEYLILYITFVAIHLSVIYFLETKSIKRGHTETKTL